MGCIAVIGGSDMSLLLEMETCIACHPVKIEVIVMYALLYISA